MDLPDSTRKMSSRIRVSLKRKQSFGSCGRVVASASPPCAALISASIIVSNLLRSGITRLQGWRLGPKWRTSGAKVFARVQAAGADLAMDDKNLSQNLENRRCL